MLSGQQIASYRSSGYLLVDRVFDDGEVAELRRVTDSFVEASRSVSASNAVYDLDPAHRPERPIIRRIKNPQDRHRVYGAALGSERLLDLVACLIGPDIRFDHGKLNFKPPAGRGAVEWHQDWAYYPHTNDDILAVGILLEDCGPESGPLMVVPGSHLGPVYDHHHDGVFIGALNPDDLGAARGSARRRRSESTRCESDRSPDSSFRRSALSSDDAAR